MANKDYSALLSNRVWPSVQDRLLSGLKGYEKNTLKTVLANTRQALLSDTQMQNLSYAPKIVLPLVRRLFPQLIANKIMSVQALEGPSGFIRYLDATVTNAAGNSTDLHPWTNAKINHSSAPTTVNDNFVADATVGNTTFAGTLTKKVSEGTLFVEVSDKATVAEAAAAGTVWSKVAEVDRVGVIRQLGALVVMGFVDPKLNTFVVNFGAAPNKIARFTYKEDMQKNIPFGVNKSYSTMNFDIKRIMVEAKSRKLGATYSFELMEDYKNEFGESFEDRMVDYLTTSILTEIDGECINMLFNSASATSSWDATLPATWTRGVNAWYETIMPKLNLVSNRIFESTHVSGATYLVCSPRVATVFQSMVQYVGTGRPMDTSMSVGTTHLGTLGGMFNVYVSPLCPANQILLGFKGTKPEETGAVYAPYVPVQLHPIYYAEGQPSVVARSRYATAMIRPDYYGVLDISGLS